MRYFFLLFLLPAFNYGQIFPVQDSSTKKYALFKETSDSNIAITAYIYDYVPLDWLSDGMNLVASEGKWYFLNKNLKPGKYKFDYADASMLEGAGRMPVLLDGKWNLVNSKGKILWNHWIPDSQFAYHPDQEIFLWLKGQDIYTFNYKKWKKNRLASDDGFIYNDFVYEFSANNFFLIPVKRVKWAFINHLGNYLTPFQYDYIGGTDQYSRTLVKWNGKYGLLSRDLSWQLEPKYEYLEICPSANRYIYSLDTKYGVIDSMGKSIIEPIFDFLKECYGVNVYIFKQSLKYGVLSFSSQVLIKPEYDNIIPFSFNSVTKFQKGKHVGFIHVNGNEIVPAEYDLLPDSPHDSMVVRKNGKYGMTTADMKIIIPFEYDNLRKSPRKNNWGFCIAEKNSKSGIIDYTGKIWVPFTYKFISEWHNYYVLYDDKYKTVGYFDPITRVVTTKEPKK